MQAVQSMSEVEDYRAARHELSQNMLPAMTRYNECLSQVLDDLDMFCGQFEELHSMTLAGDALADWRGARIFNQVGAHFVEIRSSSVALLGLFVHGGQR